MINGLILTILITLIPFLELRFSIPFAVLAGSVKFPFGMVVQGLGLNPLTSITLIIITNIILGMFLFLFFEKLGHLFLKKKRYQRFLEKRKRKISRYVDKYGVLGVALFIGIPLPGSGVYSGSFGAFLIGMKRRDYYIANLIGVLISGGVISLITLVLKVAV
ncbi:MAG: small multi-drug export protein [Nanoarchaeota archaeon]|nr:small multi-drug export protein [Nanoarchaeota archaeon]